VVLVQAEYSQYYMMIKGIVSKMTLASRTVRRNAAEKKAPKDPNSMFVENKRGRIVSRSLQKRMTTSFQQKNSPIKKWSQAVKKARTELGSAGYVSLKKGSPLYNKTRAIYNASK
jgi:hypothetical protein